jgi:hypothetical protein
MLHAGLDLSRRKIDICLVSESGEHVDQLAAAPDADALRTVARRIDEVYGESVCAVVESMTGARLVHDTLEQEGWASSSRIQGSGSQIAGTRSRWLKTASTRESILSVLQASGARPFTFCASAISTSQRAGPLSPASGQAQVGAQEPGPLDADQLRQVVPGHRPVRSRGPRTACTTAGPGALARQHHGQRGADRRPRSPRSPTSTTSSARATPTTPTSRCS